MRRQWFVAVWIALIALPFVIPHFALSVANMILINLILVASLNLLMGYAGQLSLAHAAFFGLGAYTSGVLAVHFGVSPWLGIFAAIGLAAAAAAIVGLPTLRLRGHYLAMATLGLNAIASVLFVGLRDLTGGPNGLTGVPSFKIAAFAFDNDQRFFFLAWFGASLTLLAINNVVDSRIGRALRALGQSEAAAASLGVDSQRYKLRIFVLTAGMAALAGTLYVHYLNFASPETFDFSASVMLVVAVALGGTGSLAGPVIGALIITLLPELLRDTRDLQILIFGISLVVVLLFFPRGIVGLFRKRATSS